MNKDFEEWKENEIKRIKQDIKRHENILVDLKNQLKVYEGD